MSDPRKKSESTIQKVARNLGYQPPSANTAALGGGSGRPPVAPVAPQSPVEWQKPRARSRSRSGSRAAAPDNDGAPPPPPPASATDDIPVASARGRSPSRSPNRSRSNSADLDGGIAGNGLASGKVAVTLPHAHLPPRARRWSQPMHNAFHDFILSKGGAPSVNLQREAAGYLSLAAELVETGEITEAHRERVKQLVGRGNLAQAGRELFWLVLGERTAALTPEDIATSHADAAAGGAGAGAGAGDAAHAEGAVAGAGGALATQQPRRRSSAAAGAGAAGDAGDAAASSGSSSGGASGAALPRKSSKATVVVSKRSDMKGNEMDQLHNPFFARKPSAAGGEAAAAAQHAAAHAPAPATATATA
eukprot:g8057.t1